MRALLYENKQRVQQCCVVKPPNNGRVQGRNCRNQVRCVFLLDVESSNFPSLSYNREEMQGMMLSERPAPSISTGMVDSSISIGNYKGVMLCNRPFAGAQGGAAAATKRYLLKCGIFPQ
jgi:hypothetical protein